MVKRRAVLVGILATTLLFAARTDAPVELPAQQLTDAQPPPPLDDDVVLWSAPPEERAGRPLVVLLHGFGSNETALFGLADDLPGDVVYAAVRAPLIPPRPMPRHSWYSVKDLRSLNTAGINAAAERVCEWIDRVAADMGPVGVLGFSQGAVVALQAMRLHPEQFAFTIALSGNVATEALPGDAALKTLRPHVFWGRGGADTVISEPLLAQTEKWLPAHSTLTYREYPGLGHSISKQELRDISDYIRERLDGLGAE